jgi:hypothetical protein
VSKAAAAVAATGQLQQELAALRQQNQQLRAELDAVRAERAELGTAKQAADAHAAELTKTSNRPPKARRWTRTWVRAEPTTRRGRRGARTKAEARLSEMRDSLQRAGQEKAASAQIWRGSKVSWRAPRSRSQRRGRSMRRLTQRAAALRTSATICASPGGRHRAARWSEAVKAQLEREVAELREAAGTAADARQNLIGVENRIKELNEALAAIAPAAGPVETDTTLRAAGTPSADEQADRERRAAAAPRRAGRGVAARTRVPHRTTPMAICRDRDGARDASWRRTGRAPGSTGYSRRPTCCFPSFGRSGLDKRQHVQGLLAELHSGLDERGLMTTVPGEVLFAVGSDRCRQAPTTPSPRSRN